MKKGDSLERAPDCRIYAKGNYAYYGDKESLHTIYDKVICTTNKG